MAWTETTRLHYARDASRYASDCTDAEWGVVEDRLHALAMAGCTVSSCGRMTAKVRRRSPTPFPYFFRMPSRSDRNSITSH
jgi:hypothetical protein